MEGQVQRKAVLQAFPDAAAATHDTANAADLARVAAGPATEEEGSRARWCGQPHLLQVRPRRAYQRALPVLGLLRQQRVQLSTFLTKKKTFRL